MSPIVVLTGLLLLAYFGSILAGGRAIRGFGLPSGTEFLVLGILLGPRFMSVLSRGALTSFEPLTLVALGWLALTTGVHYGWIGEARVRPRRLAAGLGFAAATFAVVATTTAGLALAFTDVRGHDLWLLALGVGCVSCETTRHAVRWVAQRYGAEGPLASLVADVSEADDAVPLVLLAVIFALASGGEDASFPPWARVVANLGAGGVMGATCAALVDIEPRNSQRWGIVLGTALLGMGASMRLGLSAVSTMFAMGIATSLLSRERATLRTMLDSTERAIMLPALVLAGASVVYPGPHPLFALGAGALAARLVVKLVGGAFLARHAGQPARLGGALGLGLLPAGVLTITCGLTFHLQVKGVVGDVVLVIATANALLGELVGPALLRRALEHAGELSAEPSRAPVPTPRPVRQPRRRKQASIPSWPGDEPVRRRGREAPR